MNRNIFFGIDHTKKLVFVFLQENGSRKLSLFIEYSNEENMHLAKQDLGIYAMFWKSNTSIQDMISLYDINPSKKLGLETWIEEN